MENEYIIRSDYEAERALKALREEKREMDRLLEIIDIQQKELEQERREIISRYNTKEHNTKFLLKQFMENVDPELKRKTNTQEKYKLVSGEVIKRLPKKVLEYDQSLLIKNKSLENQGFVIYEPKLKWSELKNTLKISNDKIINEDGEVVVIEGISIKEEPEELIIKIKE